MLLCYPVCLWLTLGDVLRICGGCDPRQKHIGKGKRGKKKKKKKKKKKNNHTDEFNGLDFGKKEHNPATKLYFLLLLFIFCFFLPCLASVVSVPPTLTP